MPVGLDRGIGVRETRTKHELRAAPMAIDAGVALVCEPHVERVAAGLVVEGRECVRGRLGDQVEPEPRPGREPRSVTDRLAVHRQAQRRWREEPVAAGRLAVARRSDHERCDGGLHESRRSTGIGAHDAPEGGPARDDSGRQAGHGQPTGQEPDVGQLAPALELQMHSHRGRSGDDHEPARAPAAAGEVDDQADRPDAGGPRSGSILEYVRRTQGERLVEPVACVRGAEQAQVGPRAAVPIGELRNPALEIDHESIGIGDDDDAPLVALDAWRAPRPRLALPPRAAPYGKIERRASRRRPIPPRAGADS